MTGVVSATLFAVLIPALHIALQRFTRVKGKHVLFMFLSFGVYVLVWGCYALIKGLPFWTDIVGGLAAAGFWCLGYMEAFSMVCRGFSLRLVLDIYQHVELSLEQVLANYADGRGIDWMLKKRISSMEELGMVETAGNDLLLKSTKGRIIGKLGNAMKSLLQMGPGGV